MRYLFDNGAMIAPFFAADGGPAGDPAPEPADPPKEKPADESLIKKASEDVPKDLLKGAGKEEAADPPKETPAGAVTLDALKLPEGYAADASDGTVADFLAVINDESLDRAALGQKLVDLYAAALDKKLAADKSAYDAEMKQRDEAFADQEKEWARASLADKEFGGEKWKASSGVIAAARDRLASPELTQLFEDFGLGNHPEVLRLYYRAGALLRPDSIASNGVPGVGPDRDTSDAARGARLFPNVK